MKLPFIKKKKLWKFYSEMFLYTYQQKSNNFVSQTFTTTNLNDISYNRNFQMEGE